MDQSLPRPEVSFRSFYRSMAEEKLNLFKLTPRLSDKAVHRYGEDSISGEGP